MPMTANRKDIYSVSRLNRTVRGLLEDVFQQVWVEGEISNLRRISSGHWYFTLKDPQAQVSCAMFRGQNRRLRFSPRDGMQVLVRGRVGLYEARGNYQVVVDQMEEGGEGALLRAYEELKQRLDRDGLFDDAHKCLLPTLPRRIGVITSAGGAALRDVLSVLRRRFPAIPVLVYPSAVQGHEAPAQLRAALTRALQRRDCDVLLLTRGGGSLEDLWAFNDEALAHLIYSADIPIVSAVGHEIDFTIADLVADRRAATPSAAAELLSPDQQGIITALQRYRLRIAVAMQRGVEQRHRQLLTLEQRLQRAHPGRRLEARSQRLDELSERLQRLVRQQLQDSGRRLHTLQGRLRQQDPSRRLQRLEEQCNGLDQRLRSALLSGMDKRRFRLEKAIATLQVVSPLATLERGYAIVTRDRDGQLLHRADQIAVDDTITARLAHGEIQCRVEKCITDV